jgi:hypothetical protein
MTRGQGQEPDETPAPPVPTRWSEDATAEGDELAPPYLPDRAKWDATSGPGETPAGPGAQPSPGEEPAFPFDEPAGEVVEAGAADAEATGAPDEYPYGAVDAVTEEESGVDVAEEPGRDGWEAEPLTGPPPDTLPTGPAYGEASLPGAEATPEPYDAPAPDVGEEVAAELERMARLVREGGSDAVAAEMSSPDRLTALLAGMVAGYLSGRR